jgi:hypothetical protein
LNQPRGWLRLCCRTTINLGIGSRICQRAVKLAARTSKGELQGIVERMSQTLKDKLKEELMEPLAYHFRQIAAKEFRAMQDESMKESQVDGGTTEAERRVKLLFKNTIFQARLEAEAEAVVDASVDIMVDMVLSRSPKDDETAGNWNDDVAIFGPVSKQIATLRPSYYTGGRLCTIPRAIRSQTSEND